MGNGKPDRTAIGIDLGTTNSVSAYFDGTDTRVLRNQLNEVLTPSVVCCEKLPDEEQGTMMVGRPAANQAMRFPKDTVFSAKRIIGRPFRHKEVQLLAKKVTYDLEESEEEKTRGQAKIRIGGQSLFPEEISALVLRNIRDYSEQALNKKVTHAVITVPAYFGEPEKAATLEAGRLAGLTVQTLLPEPTAAALAFGVNADNSQGKFVLVYDLGGGTFDISLISVVDQNYNVMRVNGDPFLGGDDFDAAIVDLILEHVQQNRKVDLSNHARFRILARTEAEKAKIALSASERTTIIFSDTSGDEDINVSMRITRDQFNEKIRARVEDSLSLVSLTLEQEGMTRDEITDVLLAGGSTAVPLVYESLQRMFGADKVRREVDPMHCVAIGAAIFAGRMKGILCPKCEQQCDETESHCPKCGASLAVADAKIDDMQVTEIAANHFGIQTVSGSDPWAFAVMVEAGTQLPMRESRTAIFETVQEHQTVIRIPVYEGMKENVLYNTRIGVILEELDQPLPKKHPVKVALQIDRNALVNYIIEVERFDIKFSGQLTRQLGADQPTEIEEEETISEEEKYLTFLESSVDRADDFLATYDRILTPGQKTRLETDISSAREICHEERASDAKGALFNLETRMLRCGVASTLNRGRLAAYHTPDEQNKTRMLQLVQELFDAAETNDMPKVKELEPKLVTITKEVIDELQKAEKIGQAEDYGGLLALPRSSETR